MRRRNVRQGTQRQRGRIVRIQLRLMKHSLDRRAVGLRKLNLNALQIDVIIRCFSAIIRRLRTG